MQRPTPTQEGRRGEAHPSHGGDAGSDGRREEDADRERRRPAYAHTSDGYGYKGTCRLRDIANYNLQLWVGLRVRDKAGEAKQSIALERRRWL